MTDLNIDPNNLNSLNKKLLTYLLLSFFFWVAVVIAVG